MQNNRKPKVSPDKMHLKEAMHCNFTMRGMEDMERTLNFETKLKQIDNFIITSKLKFVFFFYMHADEIYY